jgi:hypothetical protein
MVSKPSQKKKKKEKAFIHEHSNSIIFKDTFKVLKSYRKLETVDKNDLEVGQFSPFLLAQEFAKAKKENRMPSLKAIAQMSSLMADFLGNLGKKNFEELAYSEGSDYLGTFKKEMRFFRDLELALDVGVTRILGGVTNLDEACQKVADEFKLSKSTVKQSYSRAKKIQDNGYKEGSFTNNLHQRIIAICEDMIKRRLFPKGVVVGVRDSIRKYQKERDVFCDMVDFPAP